MAKIVRYFGQRKVVILLGVLLVLNLLLFSLSAFPGSQPQILATAPTRQIPDMMGIYSPQAVYDFLTDIGPEGRAAYQLMHFSSDLVFPLIYGMLLFALISRRLLQRDRAPYQIALLAFVGPLFDLAENFSMVAITNSFPTAMPGLTRLAQVFTLLKFGGIGLSILTILVLAVRNTRRASAP
ncbi:hypothetical protein KQH62_03670 [bacterium]|nr:hypothetical protein [bacterium]